MSRRTKGLLKAALSALHYSGVDGALGRLSRGCGVIFMLHHVQPQQPGEFEPNKILKVTPDFLEEVIGIVIDRGFDVLSLDEVELRLSEGDIDRPFACFTFDDGYRDNKQYAYPIFHRYGLPFAIYVPSDFPDGRGDLWWLKLEKVVSALETVEVKMHGAYRRFECRTARQKEEAFEEIYWWLRSIPETDARAAVSDLCHLHGIDVESLCRDLVMSWDEIRDLAKDPLVTIGAHTRRHFAVGKLSAAEARLEIEEGVRRIEAELGRQCRHFSFPYGDAGSAGPRDFEIARELGLKTAVTTQKGLIHPKHGQALTALPRLSLNGEFQQARYVKVMLTGAPFAIWRLAQRLTLRPQALPTR
ncbi:MAG: polysaccharide deacetylase family protein [Hyphomicrobiaceae bacterium]